MASVRIPSGCTYMPAVLGMAVMVAMSLMTGQTGLRGLMPSMALVFACMPAVLSMTAVVAMAVFCLHSRRQ